MATNPLGRGNVSVTYLALDYDAIIRLCRKHRIKPSTFGREAVGDPRLIHDLGLGRRPRPSTVARVEQFVLSLEGAL